MHSLFLNFNLKAIYSQEKNFALNSLQLSGVSSAMEFLIVNVIKNLGMSLKKQIEKM